MSFATKLGDHPQTCRGKNQMPLLQSSYIYLIIDEVEWKTMVFLNTFLFIGA